MPLKFKPLPGDPFGEGEVVDQGGTVPDSGAVFAPMNDGLDLLRFLQSHQPAPAAEVPLEPEPPARRVKLRGI